MTFGQVLAAIPAALEEAAQDVVALQTAAPPEFHRLHGTHLDLIVYPSKTRSHPGGAGGGGAGCLGAANRDAAGFHRLHGRRAFGPPAGAAGGIRGGGPVHGRGGLCSVADTYRVSCRINIEMLRCQPTEISCCWCWITSRGMRLLISWRRCKPLLNQPSVHIHKSKLCALQLVLDHLPLDALADQLAANFPLETQQSSYTSASVLDMLSVASLHISCSWCWITCRWMRLRISLRRTSCTAGCRRSCCRRRMGPRLPRRRPPHRQRAAKSAAGEAAVRMPDAWAPFLLGWCIVLRCWERQPSSRGWHGSPPCRGTRCPSVAAVATVCQHTASTSPLAPIADP